VLLLKNKKQLSSGNGMQETKPSPKNKLNIMGNTSSGTEKQLYTQ